jgi:hypothetical protein
VLTGWVVAVSPDTGLDERRRVNTLHDNDAMRFDARKGISSPIKVDQDRFARSWEDVLYKPRTSGPIAFERSMPSSLLPGAVESDGLIHLFLEATDIVPAHEVTVGITEPGFYRTFEGLSGTLPAGTRVDSYLIHWEPPSRSGTAKATTGRVSFRRPILGLIVESKCLVASDKPFGHPGVSYPIQNDSTGRSLESPPDKNSDTLILTQDRLTLDVTLRASAMDQIRILIMAASEDEK